MSAKETELQVARSLLEQVRDDPHGWASLDLAKLLDLWDFVSEELDTESAWRPVFWHHPEQTDLYVVLYPEDEVHSDVTLHVVRIIDKLIHRTT